jgi:hypothetical protein
LRFAVKFPGPSLTFAIIAECQAEELRLKSSIRAKAVEMVVQGGKTGQAGSPNRKPKFLCLFLASRALCRCGESVPP